MSEIKEKVISLSQEFADIQWGNLSDVGEFLKSCSNLDESISGNSTALKDALQKLIEGLENHILGEYKDKGVSIASLEVLLVELHGKVQAEDWNQIEERGTPPEHLSDSHFEDRTLIVDFVAESLEHLDSIEHKLLNLESDPENLELLNEIFRPLHNIKGISGFLNLKVINKLAHEAETFLDLARVKTISLDKEFIDITLKVVDVMARLIDCVGKEIEGKKCAETEFPNVDKLVANISSYINKRTKKNGEQIQEEIANPNLEQKVSGTINSKSGAETSLNSPQSENIKINSRKLDNLLDMVGELVVAQTLISQSSTLVGGSDKSFSKNVTHANKIVRNIQNISMSLRMVPVKNTFSKMNRLVRDLSKKAGKEITLTIKGAETELDRNVIDNLNDPLVHMMRNAIDHGIEKVADRKKCGKTPEGQISLNAFHQGGNIVIEVVDDGCGLNPEKIFGKAVQKNIIPKNSEMTHEDILDLIFHPGFSTASKVTDISGRGVGMDVVKKNIEKLGGNVQIESEMGKGCRFIIRLPLTMAIMDGMVLRVGEERYLLPVLSIVESIRVSQEDLLTVGGKGEMVRVREKLIQLIRLHEIFDIEPDNKIPTQSIVVIVEIMGKSFGLMVDGLVGQQQVVIKNMKYTFGDLQGISGYAILGDGRVGLIIDPKKILSLSRSRHPQTSRLVEEVRA